MKPGDVVSSSLFFYQMVCVFCLTAAQYAKGEHQYSAHKFKDKLDAEADDAEGEEDEPYKWHQYNHYQGQGPAHY